MSHVMSHVSTIHWDTGAYRSESLGVRVSWFFVYIFGKVCETYGWAKRSMKFQQQQIMELFSNNVVENDSPFLGLETPKPNKCDPIKDGTGGEKGNNNNNNNIPKISTPKTILPDFSLPQHVRICPAIHCSDLQEGYLWYLTRVCVACWKNNNSDQRTTRGHQTSAQPIFEELPSSHLPQIWAAFYFRAAFYFPKSLKMWTAI